MNNKPQKKPDTNALPKIDWHSWSTSDNDEINRRKIRAHKEIFTLDLPSPFTYFGTFHVHSESAKHYHVEIRSLDEYINSCNCTDYRGNGLGTCKHIEYVLMKLQKKGVRSYAKAMKNGSEHIEIYLSAAGNRKQVMIKWPKQLPKLEMKEIEAFFSADGSLLGENLVTSYNKFVAHLKICTESLVKEVRLSKYIDYFIDYQTINQQKEISRQFFMDDVAAGKRSLNPVKAQLLPYQVDGMLHLAFTERALLADEMGLGKTIQAIAACELLKQSRQIQRVLIVTTASLKSEWEEQIIRFCDSSSLIIYGTRATRLKQYKNSALYYLMNYEQVVSDYKEIQENLAPDVIVLDEAQRIKNWQTKTANKIKELKSRYAFVLTGTPIENRIDDIYSLVQFLDPHVFGPLFRFNRDFYELDENGKAIGYKNLNQMYHKLRPIMLCRKKIDVEEQLPDKTVKNYFVTMDEEQQARYTEYEGYVSRILAKSKKRPLRKEEMEKLQRFLACMRMVCDTPFILDDKYRASPKVSELKLILEEICADPTNKIIIFSEWERMLILVHEMLTEINIDVAWHTGSINQKQRRININQFKNDPNCRVFLSTDAGSVGLNLQVANVVVNMDLPWNPAKLDQRIARAWRKNQMRQVQVINLICEKSIEHRMLYLLEQKRTMATAVLTDDESLSSMKMPSGRAAFMERMENLMNVTFDENKPHPEINKAPKNELAPEIEKVKQAIIENVGNNLDLAQLYNSPENKPTILAVVNNKPTKNIEAQIKDQLADFAIVSEIIDAETFALLERLAKAGILTLNLPITKIYDKTNDDDALQRRKEQRDKANYYLEQSAHKARMSDVLLQSEFIAEALAPLQESHTHTIKAFCHLMGETSIDLTTEPLTLPIITDLANKYKVPWEMPLLFSQILENKGSHDPQTLLNNQYTIIDTVTKLCQQET